MSKALASASRLKPQIRLSQAIAEFQADLSTDQKAEFDNHTARACRAPPSTNDVMYLTAEIDQQLSRKHRRCLGTRTTSFLQSVQQFASLGDILVGGSQNLIACGVWTLVRMSLLMLLGFSNYFEKLSHVFMTIGRSAPRYEKLALLYPRSNTLRSSLCEYFIVAVHLCHHILKFTKKSAFGKLGSTLNDPELPEYQSQLETWAEEIKGEVTYLMAQRIEEQADVHTRILSTKSRKSNSYQRRMREYLRALKFCSTYDHITPWKQARKSGHTTLFCQCPEFMRWKDLDGSSSLILTGPLGSGKSVLMANMVDYLNLQSPKTIPIIFFFCRHDLPESLLRRVVIGSLTRQLLEQGSDSAEKLEDWDLANLNEWDKMRRMLNLSLPSDFKVCLVIDGLDECTSSDRVELIEDLRYLQDSFSVSICVTLRQTPRYPLSINRGWNKLASIIVASVPNNAADIETFIAAELEARIESGNLTVGDPAIILEIEDKLLEGSQGMFLWVALQIDSLCFMDTDEAIRLALADLPPDLSTTFSRILNEADDIRRPSFKYRRNIFEFVAAAHHPLTLDELREALGVTPGDTTWNPSRLPNSILDTLTCCGSLLMVDEEGMTVRFVHSSVKQFLTDPGTQTDWILTLDTAHRHMADVIITYLNYGVFEKQLVKRPEPLNLSVGSAPSTIIQSSLGLSGTAKDIAVKLLRSRKKPGFDMGKTLGEMNLLPQKETGHHFRFLSYAIEQCLFHVSHTAKGPKLKDLLLRLLHRKKLHLKVGVVGPNLLFWAAEYNHEETLKVLCQYTGIDLNVRDENGRTPLHVAALFGNEIAVNQLLSYHAVDKNVKDDKGWTPLITAIHFAPESVCKALIECEQVSTNEPNSQTGQTPLHIAVLHSGTAGIVEMLLRQNKTHPNLLDPNNLTALQRAFEVQNKKVVPVMLQSNRVKVDLDDWDDGRHAILTTAPLGDAADINPNTPLHNAIAQKDDAMIAILLNYAMFVVNVQDHKGDTPLHRAVYHGSEKLACELLELGVDFRIENLCGSIALHTAAANGLVNVVRRMLEHEELDPNHQNRRGVTPLHLAFRHNQHTVARILLASGKVDPNIEDFDGRMPLEYSALRLSTPIIRLLFDSEEIRPMNEDLSLDWTNYDGQSLLQRVIACRPKPETLDMLLTISDFDATYTDNEGRTALHSAVIYGAGIQLLLDTEKYDYALRWKDHNGLTPQDLAEKLGNRQAIRAVSTSKSAMRAYERLEHRKMSG